MITIEASGDLCEKIAVRNRFEGDQGSMEVDQFVTLIKDFVDKKVTKP